VRVGVGVVLEHVRVLPGRTVRRVGVGAVVVPLRHDQVGGVAVALGRGLAAVEVDGDRDRQLVPMAYHDGPVPPGLDGRTGEDAVVTPDLGLEAG
jgi:hypothetical protein